MFAELRQGGREAQSQIGPPPEKRSNLEVLGKTTFD